MKGIWEIVGKEIRYRRDKGKEERHNRLRYKRNHSLLNLNWLLHYTCCYQIARFKVTAKSYNIAT
jgi:hypothetical protein